MKDEKGHEQEEAQKTQKHHIDDLYRMACEAANVPMQYVQRQNTNDTLETPDSIREKVLAVKRAYAL